MKKNLFRWGAVVSTLVLLIGLLVLPAQAAWEPPACPWTDGVDGYVVDLAGPGGYKWIRSDYTSSAAETAHLTLASPIPAGTYDITLFSYDDHDPDKPGQVQPNEQWYVTDGSFASGTIDDLADNLNTITQQVDTARIVPQLTQLWAHHAYYPNSSTGSTSANSITPICVAFAPVQEETGSIKVIKNTTNGDSTFSFLSESLGGFDVTTVSGTGSKTFEGLTAGTYGVVEDVPGLGDGWALLGDPYCEGTAHEGTFSPSEFTLASGESVTCTFANAYTEPPNPGSITVYKVTADEVSDETFTFTLNGSQPQAVEANSELSGFWGSLDGGVFDLVEGPKPGWDFEGSECGLGDQVYAAVVESGTTFEDIARGVRINLAQGDQVVCRFYNDESPPPPPPPPTTTTTTSPLLGSIGDFVWNDANTNGIQDAGETGIAGVAVNLLDQSGTSLASTNTDADGHYRFGGLVAGDYIVEFVAPAKWELSLADQGSDDTIDSDAGIGGRAAVTLAEGAGELTIDAGMHRIPEVEPTTAVRPPETLPFTGASSSGMGGAAVGLVLLGGLILLAVRRKEDDIARHYTN